MDFGAVMWPPACDRARHRADGAPRQLSHRGSTGDGRNFFFAYSVVAVGVKVPWPSRLALSRSRGSSSFSPPVLGCRERLTAAIPTGLKHAIAAGIGLLIAFIGLQWAGIVVASPGTSRGAPATSTAAPWAVGACSAGVDGDSHRATACPRRHLCLEFSQARVVGLALGPRALRGHRQRATVSGADTAEAGHAGNSRPGMPPVILVFFFLALFDSVGTLVGVGEQAGSDARRHAASGRGKGGCFADAIGTVAGAALGTSTVTAYIESGAGVAAGGRHGAGQPRHLSAVPAFAVLPSAGADGGRRLRRWGSPPCSRHRGAADTGRHDDDRRSPACRLGGSDRIHSCLPDGHHDAARRQHHRVWHDRPFLKWPPAGAVGSPSADLSFSPRLFIAGTVSPLRRGRRFIGRWRARRYGQTAQRAVVPRLML